MELARLLTDNGRELATVELAVSAMTRARGLLGRSGLERGRALWLTPCRSIHTIGMRFTIDVVFVDRDWRVLKMFATLPPMRLAWGGFRSIGALEFAAGESGRLGLAPGQRLRLE